MKIRVLVIDDSALMRGLLTEMINSAPDVEVVGAAPDGAGVEEDQVGVVAPVHGGVAEALQQAPHPLGVVVVHLAPEGGQVVAHTVILEGGRNGAAP